MHNFNMPSSLKIVLMLPIFVLLFFSCSPIKEKLQPKGLVEMDYVDPELVKQNSDSPDHNVVGNLSYEIQKDYSNNKTTLFAMASFHEPTSKNVLFDKVKTNSLAKNEYKPKPVDQPCGIPGFPDCPNTPNPAPNPNPAPTPTPPVNPDEPCGIPGFPECPIKQEIISN
jgi:hypothetical protein